MDALGLRLKIGAINFVEWVCEKGQTSLSWCKWYQVNSFLGKNVSSNLGCSIQEASKVFDHGFWIKIWNGTYCSKNETRVSCSKIIWDSKTWLS